jgi:AcrR family transcriptional regulator
MTAGHILMNTRHPLQRIPKLAPTLRRGLRERRKDEVRQRLFRAAVELFGTRGFNATTVEDITRAADVGKGTFFNYFKTKEMLLSSWAELRLDILRRARSGALQGREPVKKVLHRLLGALLEEPTRSRTTGRCMLLGLLGSEPAAEMLQDTTLRARRVLTDIIVEGQKRGEIRRNASAGDLAGLFQQTFFGIMHLWILMPGQNLKKRTDTSFELFWAAAAVPPQVRERAR